MILSGIVALSENGVIGRAGGLPWRLPDDLRRFRELTWGHPVVMGRRTYESIGRPLPGRTIVVLSRGAPVIPGVLVAPDIDTAIERLRGGHGDPGQNEGDREDGGAIGGEGGGAFGGEIEELFVAGGGEVYRSLLARLDRLHLTRVHAEVDGDVLFPELDLGSWQRIDAAHHPADERHEWAFTFETWERR